VLFDAAMNLVVKRLLKSFPGRLDGLFDLLGWIP